METHHLDEFLSSKYQLKYRNKMKTRNYCLNVHVHDLGHSNFENGQLWQNYQHGGTTGHHDDFVQPTSCCQTETSYSVNT